MKVFNLKNLILDKWNKRKNAKKLAIHGTSVMFGEHKIFNSKGELIYILKKGETTFTDVRSDENKNLDELEMMKIKQFQKINKI